MTSSQPPEKSQSDAEHASFAERLKQKYGEGVDPEVSLDRPAADAPSSASSELLRRLSDHSLKESRYKLQGEIARGGMGAILKVWDEDLRRTLAMKVILGKVDSRTEGGTPPVDSRLLGRFLEEAQVTGQLDHPGIAPVHELGLDSDGRVYFTMKLVKGRDLKQVFDLVFQGKEGWNETRALSVMLKVCEAMAYAHTKGVIHRDLKPANVMVGSFGEVYVMDWGLARVLGRKDAHDIRLQGSAGTLLTSVKTERREEREEAPDSPLVTMDGDVMGTPAYMPLEQARGEIEKLSARSDVYSIGAMLYHLLASRMPYVPPGERITNRTVLSRVLDGPPKPIHSIKKDVPAELVAICEKAMSRDAAQRYPDTLALADDLRAYLEHRVVTAYETGALAELKKWVARNKSLAASIAGAAAILVAGVVTSLTFATRASEKATELESSNVALGIAKRTAETNARLAQQKADDVLSLSAEKDLEDLVARAERLWPAHPDKIGDYEKWLSDARELIAGRAAEPERNLKARPSLAQHQAKLAEIRAQAVPQTEDEARWWEVQLSKLVATLEALRDPVRGLMDDNVAEPHGWGVTKRYEFAKTIRERSVDGPIAKARWDAASAAIASSPKYGGLKLTPQLGLLPIGVDAHSGLSEFAHLQTGDPALRGADGKLVVTEQTGLVFVLIPGGTFAMGAQSLDPTEANYDPQASSKESPVHAVTLSPYFLSKYEMTQGQWSRITARNPSKYGPSSNFQSDLTHPVELVAWTDCMEWMERIGLLLPSEAQWEYGCRAGTDTPWWTGAERESLRGKINIADRTAKSAGVPWREVDDWPDLEDGWVVHAPVGTLAANPYGLHEVHGNVWEWCRDGWYGLYSVNEQLDPVAPCAGASARVFRGGSFDDSASNVRSSHRFSHTPENQFHNLGLRPARAIATL